MNSDLAQRILEHLRERMPGMIDTLAQFVRAESPSTVPQSQDAVLSMLGERLRRVRYKVSRLKDEIAEVISMLGLPGASVAQFNCCSATAIRCGRWER